MGKIDFDRLPQHIAFIMDGNGRWAKRRGLGRGLGHRAGFSAMVQVVERLAELGVKYATFYAFSTENWKRSESEIGDMFAMIREKMDEVFTNMAKMGVRIRTMGDIAKFPEDMQAKLAEAVERTKNNTRLTVVICANYGGRAEILGAVNRLRREVGFGEIDEATFGKFLQSDGIPDPDLIVRTSGEQRLSNFLLWQCAYAELLFLEKHWPDMDKKMVDKCVVEFQKRDRRFGKV